MKLKQLDSSSYPREKLIMSGAQNLSDCELLAILLQSGSKQRSILNLCNYMLAEYGTVTNIFKLHINELKEIDGIGDAKATKIVAFNELCQRINQKHEINRLRVTSASDVFEIFQDIKYEKQEKLICISIDNKGAIIAWNTVYIGTINEMIVHPREIYKHAFNNLAYAIILLHNHPSGDCTPSEADLETTKKIIEISTIMSIPLVDHIIIGDNQYYSMKEKCGIIFTIREKE